MLYLKILWTACLCILFSMPAFAQEMERVRRNIQLLCAPEMAGRGYTMNGDKNAAQLIAKAFREAGVQPFGSDYYQSFPLTVNTFPQKMCLSVGNRKLQAGRDFIPNPVSGAGRGNVRLVYLDTLLARGDSAVIKKAMATNYKGKGVVFRMTDYAQMLERCPELIPQLNKAKVWIGLSPFLMMHISSQALQPPFLIAKSAVLDASAQKANFRIDNQLKTNYITQNVIGYVKGIEKPEQFVVFTAHYDHLGTMGNQAYIPGANDNAAGVAMLIELAYYFAKKPPPFSVCFMAFSGEELGLLGSLHYVSHPLFPLSQIQFLWNVDLIGTGKDGATVVNATIHTSEFEKLKTINKELQALPEIVPRAPAANSDHYPFSVKGVPAFFVYLMDKNYPYYHHVDDKAENLPLTGFQGLFQLLVKMTEK